MNGSEVLAEIKRDPDLKTIPVLVLTTSEATDVDFERFREIVHQIDEFFVGVVELPLCEAA
jgi:CheY-like chemotaxis protein